MGGFRGYQHARISARKPEALGRCDRCGWVRNLVDLKFQHYFQGPVLQNTYMLVCRDCLDTPNPQTRTIIIPPDPLPVLNPRIEDYASEIASWLSTEADDTIGTEDDDILVTESATPTLV